MTFCPFTNASLLLSPSDFTLAGNVEVTNSVPLDVVVTGPDPLPVEVTAFAPTPLPVEVSAFTAPAIDVTVINPNPIPVEIAGPDPLPVEVAAFSPTESIRVQGVVAPDTPVWTSAYRTPA